MTSKNDLGLQERDQHDFDDHRRPLVRALRLGSSALLVVTIVSLMSWGGYQGLPGIWGVLIGAAMAGGFLLVTVVSMLFTASTTPTTTGAVVLVRINYADNHGGGGAWHVAAEDHCGVPGTCADPGPGVLLACGIFRHLADDAHCGVGNRSVRSDDVPRDIFICINVVIMHY